jgi:mannose-1-phosphate guanylyltransferase
MQPCNKGTAPAILSALIHIVRRDPNAIVAILPCYHAYTPERAFTAALKSAFQICKQRSGSVVLLGLEPRSHEADYDWIEVGETVSGHRLAEVKRLEEKPSLPISEKLFKAGSLWNTYVMVGHVCTFLEMAWATVPGLLQALESREVLSRDPNPGDGLQSNRSNGFHASGPVRDFASSIHILPPVPIAIVDGRPPKELPLTTRLSEFK